MPKGKGGKNKKCAEHEQQQTEKNERSKKPQGTRKKTTKAKTLTNHEIRAQIKQLLKPARSAYILWSKDHRQPEDDMKSLGERWSKTTPAEKKIYEDRATEEARVHKEQKQNMSEEDKAQLAHLTQLLCRNKQKKQPKKTKSIIKNPSSAYIFFSQAHRESVKQELLTRRTNQGEDSNPSTPLFSEIAAELGERWHKLTEQEKAPFIEQSRQDKERYIRECTAQQSLEEQQQQREAFEGGQV